MGKRTNAGLSRRQLLQRAGAAGAGAALATPLGTVGRALAATKPRVAVLGGGMAGLTAAHELIERGFAVTVYERKALGGKARSMPSDLPATGGRKPLPGEHGFRFFPGFYHHIPDTMRRIPFPGNAGGVRDNLVSASSARISLAGAPDLNTPFGLDANAFSLVTPASLLETLKAVLNLGTQIPLPELLFFVNRLLVFLTSCDERRLGQWEKVSWYDYIEAEGKSDAYAKILGSGLTRGLVAAKEQIASTRTIANMGEAFLLNILGRGNDGDPDRVLNGPTTEVWIDPWVAHLQGLGVEFRVGWSVNGLSVADRRITAASATDAAGTVRQIDADWFVCAMPAERAVQLWSPQVLAADPSLEGMNDLFVDWMNGIQLFLRRNAPLTRGHVAYMDSPWSLTSINQAQFWPRYDFARDFGDGGAVDCLSVDISDWDTKGILYGKTAKTCTREEIKEEVWAQIKASVNDHTPNTLRDADLHSWYLDPAIQWDAGQGGNTNDEPLLVNTVDSWKNRPKAATRLRNLFLAGDYVQTDIDLATMEGANESGRAATNALLDAAGSSRPRATTYKLLDPPEFALAKAEDRVRYGLGLRNRLDV